jgi:hypothetical protein
VSSRIQQIANSARIEYYKVTWDICEGSGFTIQGSLEPDRGPCHLHLLYPGSTEVVPY